MKKTTKLAGLAIATAAAIALTTMPTTSALAKSSKSTKVKCVGVNKCKGHSKCASAKNSCKGHNKCKGQGWVYKSSSKSCKKAGGTVMKPAKKTAKAKKKS